MPASDRHRKGTDASLTVEKDIGYKSIDGTALLLDIYRTRDITGSLKPALIVIHGGGFEGGSKSLPHLQGFSRHMANLGYVVFNINYRLAPKYRYMETLSDVKNAVQWIKYRSEVYGVDPNRIGAVGFSAGAYLTAMLALDTAPPIDTPAELSKYSYSVTCAVIMYGLFDLPAFLVKSHANSQVTSLLGKSYEQDPELWKKASPITHVAKNAPPIYLFHGTADTAVPVDQSREFYQAMKNKGADIQYMELEGAGHGWKRDSDFGRKEDPELVNFLARHLKR